MAEETGVCEHRERAMTSHVIGLEQAALHSLMTKLQALKEAYADLWR
jgi:hypothetical protein